MTMSGISAHQGYSIRPAALPPERCQQLIEAVSPCLAEKSTAGIRGLARKIPAVDQLARSIGVRELIEPILGKEAVLVRSILFNKSPESNWQVGWHQDLTIAVQEKSELEGFSAWTTKDGIHHVQPPTSILEKMLTLRLHLDTADADNGALWVIPGSHNRGRLAAKELEAITLQHEKVLCGVEAGGVLLLRPLLLHASFKAASSRPRRVIHLEFAACHLPAGLRWQRG